MSIITNGTHGAVSPPVTSSPSEKRALPTEIRLDKDKSISYFRKVSKNDARLWVSNAYIEVLAKKETLARPIATAERCLALAYRWSVLKLDTQEIAVLLPEAIKNLQPVQRGRLIKVFHFLDGKKALAVKKTLYVHLYHQVSHRPFPGVSIQEGYQMKLGFADELLALPSEALMALELPGLKKISHQDQKKILEAWKGSLNCFQLCSSRDLPAEVMPNKYFPAWEGTSKIFLDASLPTGESSIGYSRLVEGLNAKSVTFQPGSERRDQLVELQVDHLPDVDENKRPFFNTVNVICPEDLEQPYIKDLITKHETYSEALTDSRLSKRQKTNGQTYGTHSNLYHKVMELDLFINNLLFPGVPAHWPAPTTPTEEPVESLMNWLNLKISQTSAKSRAFGKQSEED